MRKLALERAARIIVPTAAVARDAAGLLRVDADHIHVIPKAPDAAFTPRGPDEIAAVRERYGLPRAYLLWVGALQHPDPRRRVPALVALPRELDLVLVGEPGRWARRAARRPPHGRRVRRRPRRAVLGRPRAPAARRRRGLRAARRGGARLRHARRGLRAPRAAGGARTRATFVDRDDLAGLIAAAEAAERPAPAPPHWTWADAADATWTVYERALASA